MNTKRQAWNKGKKMPHSKEWEERRLAAVKKSSQSKVYPKGYHRPKEYTQPMNDALEIKRRENPERYRAISIGNLPKNNWGMNNGNWKGGITPFIRNFRSSKAYRDWRRGVLESFSNACANCGSTKNLEAHHLVPIHEDMEFALIPMNGVALCRKCHKETDSYAQRSQPKGLGFSFIRMITIPHSWQVYDTVGNWAFSESGKLLVTVSDMGNPHYEWFVGCHEIDEALLCKKHGVDEKLITEYDQVFEDLRNKYPEIIGDQEPGNMVSAPYHDQHESATFLEMERCEEFGEDWDEYDKKVNEL